uniref:Uncharacterized protein n=1 Tax=Solanum lycopersicum TaxID=4081 RepID=A0A3Q7EUD4_SOLLC
MLASLRLRLILSFQFSIMNTCPLLVSSFFSSHCPTCLPPMLSMYFIILCSYLLHLSLCSTVCAHQSSLLFLQHSSVGCYDSADNTSSICYSCR